MSIYFAVIFTDLVRHSAVWNNVSRDAAAEIVTEYRYLSQSLASQYGRRHENFTGDGHLFLFESADVAVHFSLKLIAYWKQRRRSLAASQYGHDLPIRVGCHFGECYRISDDDAWIGRAINIAKRVEASADPDSLFISQTILELIDLPVYNFQDAGSFELKGDFLACRQLYRMVSVDQAALAARPEDKMTAEDWFLRGVGFGSRSAGAVEDELLCYRRALELRATYPEAHNNLGILLKRLGDAVEAAEHYQEALRLWPNYPEGHYNYAILLQEMGDIGCAEMHYRDAIRLRPDFVDARLRYAGLLEANDDPVQTDCQYREVLRLRPAFAEANNNYGVFLERMGDTAGAEAHYVRALEHQPDYAEAHYNYAMLLEPGDQRRAEEEYRAAIRARPNYVEAHNNLAVLLHEIGDLPAAERHYLAALQLKPDDPGTNYNLALLAQAKGDAEAANRHFRLAEALRAGECRSPANVQLPQSNHSPR
ncbi:tetratricopeptide repeat protein [Rhizobium sp. Nf11,1]|uniref:tetratricopeptide repeat protein n=1 Tax=Rhizobium sp. Nf11,1 TaxID=3404923 RepID=UPI003D34084F